MRNVIKSTAFIALSFFAWCAAGQGLANVSYGKLLAANANPSGIECAHADASGNIYLAGVSKSTGNFGEALKLGGTLAPTPTGGNYFFYILKHNPDGTLQSSTFLYSNSTSTDTRINIRAITTDGSGNVYVSGFFVGTVDFDGSGVVSSRVNTSGSTFLAKYDASLNLVWAKNFGGGGGVNYVLPEDIKISPTTGNVWIAGYLVGDNTQAILNDADPNAGVVTMTGLSTSKAGFACAYTAAAGGYVAGSLTNWINNSFLASDDVLVKALAINSLGKIFVAGSFEKSMSNCAGLLPITTTNATAAFLASFDPGPSNCALVNISAFAILDLVIDPTNNNNVYVAGFDNAGGMVAKYNAALVQQWSRTAGSKINSIGLDNSTMIYAAGYNASGNAFVQKYNTSGTAQFGANGYALTNISGYGFEEVQLTGSNILLGGTWGFGMGFNSNIGFDDDNLVVSFPNTSTSQNHQFWGIYYLDNVGSMATITSTASSPTKVSPIPITVTFDEPIALAGGYIPADHDIVNATVSNVVQVNSTTFTFNLTPTVSQGTVSYQIFTGMFEDAHHNLNQGSNLFSISYDAVAPTVSITSSSASTTSVSPIPVTITFSEAVSFNAIDLTVTNGTAGNLQVINGLTYTVDVTPTGAGTVTVALPANKVTDAAGNGNAISNTLTRTFTSADTTPPTIIISSTSPDPTNTSPIPVSFTFSEVVTGFVVGDIGVANGTAGAFAGSGTTYTANITPSGPGIVTVSVAANVATDAATNGNTIATNLVRTFDNVAPTVIISSTTASTTSSNPIPITFTFSEGVTGFALADIIVSGGSAGNLAGSGTTYTADITPTAPGTVTVSVAANIAADAATNGNSVATNLVRTYTTADTTPPTIIISSTSPDPTNTSPIPVSFTFSESVTGFVVGDIGVANGTAGAFAGSGTTYTANITPSGPGIVTVSVAANVATDAATNGNTVATNLTRTFDNVAPTVTITSSATDPTNVAPIAITITFSESVTGFIVGDISVTNGTAGNLAGTGAVYTADITPTGAGAVTVSVASNKANDIAGNNNAASNTLSRTYNLPSGSLQYASSVIGFSSEYTTTTYSASQATGAPNVYPSCMDNALAWAHGNMDGQREFIKLGFTTPMTVYKIEIYETNAAGSVDSVYLRNASTGVWNKIYSVTAAGTACSILTINITETAYPVDAIRIAMNSPLVTGWNEIDAVGITGNTVADTTPPTLTISSAATNPTNVTPIPVTFTFSESVTGFVVGDIGVTNGTAGTFAGSGTTYTANITPSGQGTVTVSVAASVATDAATNGNTAATNLTRVFDSVAPTATISSTATDPTKVSPIPVTITFSESVTGFVVGDIGVTNGIAGSFAGSGTTYTANITPSGQGTLTVSVAANVATDAATNGNTAATNLTRVFDSVAPTATISSTATDPTKVSPIPVTITFSESVTGFVVGDIGVTNGTAGTFAGSGTTYTANITPTGQGTVTVSVAASVATDAATNGNTAATNLTRVFDNVAPTVTITSSAPEPTKVSPIPVTITFSESVTGFVVGDITVTNGTAGTFAGSGTTYTANITPSGQGTVTVSVAASVATDAATNGNTAATNLVRVFDSVAPTVTITSSTSDPTSTSPIPVTITFSESVTGFVVGDITVLNGSAGNFAGSGTTYTADITPSGQVTVSVSVAAAKATDAALNNNSASNTLTRTYNNTSPTVSISSTATEPTNVTPIPITITFSESVTGFIVGEITVTNGTAGNFSGSGTTYTANVTPTGQGAVTVSVAANVALNGTSVGNTVSNLLTRTFDTVAPTTTISSTATDPTKVTPIPITITFSESVTGFVVGDIGVANGSAGNFAGSGTTYTANITPTGQGLVTVSVATNVATDAATNGNTAATNLTRTFDNVAPTVAISSTAPTTTNIAPIPVTITFSESVTGFVVGDIGVANGSAGNFAGSGTTYTANITPSGQGTVTVSVAANVATDAATNGNTAATNLTRTFDNVAPTVTITSSTTDPTSVSPIPVTITFSESVVGFVIGDITVTNGSAGNFAGSGTTYTADITPTGQITVSVNVAAAKATDAALNNNTASNTLMRTYNNTSPTVTISSSATEPTNASPIPVTVTFSESVTGFVSGELMATNGVIGNFAGSGTTYTANITPSGQGAVTVSVAANVALSGTSVGNSASNTLTRTFDTVAPTVTITSIAPSLTNVSPIPVTVTFSESVTGFAIGDIGVVNGSAGNFVGSGTTYTANITPTGQGVVTVGVVANVATDAATNGNTAATSFTRTFDNVAPTVTISSTATEPTKVSPIPVTITFSESVTGLVVGDIGVTNGTAGTFAGSGTTYTANITPSGQGTVTVSVAANVAADAASNGNTAPTNLIRVFDSVAPTVTVTSGASDPTSTSPIPVTITFSESVTGFVVGDVGVTNGTAGGFAGSGTTYTANITPSGQGTVTVSVAANVANDAATNGNVVSNTLSRTFTSGGLSNQTITFDAITNKTLGDAIFNVTATATSGLAVAFSSASDKISIAGTQVTMIKAGSVTITANQAGDASFNPAPSVDRTFCINPAKPTISISGADTETVVLTSSSATGNQWFKDGVPISAATANTLNVISVGTYSVQVTVETCTSLTSNDFPIIVTGLELHPPAATVYPNPTVGKVTIQIPGGRGGDIQIATLTGIPVLMLASHRDKEELTIDHFSAGMYFVTITTPTGLFKTRLVKQ